LYPAQKILGAIIETLAEESWKPANKASTMIATLAGTAQVTLAASAREVDNEELLNNDNAVG
jgi:hypothetical protein